MYSLINALGWPLRLAGRFLLACRFRLQLGYSWHLAWVKAAR